MVSLGFVWAALTAAEADVHPVGVSRMFPTHGYPSAGASLHTPL